MSLVDKINSVNEFGIAQLAAHGVEIISPPTLYPAPPDPDLITTYDIMSAISMISSGEGGGIGIKYKSIIYNIDGTVTLIDTDDVEHTMSCAYEDGKIISVTLDGKETKLSYSGDDLVAVGSVATDLSNVPKNSTSGIMFETKPNAEIFTMYPATTNSTLSDSSFNANATAVITEV